MAANHLLRSLLQTSTKKSLFVIIVFIFFISSCVPKPAPSNPTPEPTATQAATNTPQPVTEPTLEPTPTSAPSDPVWDRIQAAGQIVVGISADYPPFAYVGDDFAVQGYDLALIQEIGRRLDMPLDIKVMAFDGLLNALQLGQIDLAIAAISQTPERDAYIDFSNVYYVSEDAIIAPIDTPFAINRVEDLAGYRVGVQKESVYETWLKNTLVDTGLMQPQNLIAFDTVEEGLQSLNPPNPVVNFFVMDLLPAQAAANKSPVKIVSQGLNSQQYAIGLPQGGLVLKQKVDDVLVELYKDGTLTALAKQYLNVDNLPEYPTPVPTAPPATPSACLDGMTWVQDLTYPDNNMLNPPQFDPGAPIQKGWRIRNTGACNWDNTYVLAYAGSNPENAPVGGNPVAIQGIVAPGQTYDIYVNLEAPFQAGLYQSFWTLKNANGLSFGDRLYAGFGVVGQPPTAIPTKPVIYSFNADQTTISEGQCVTLNWAYGGTDLARALILQNGTNILKDMPYSGSYTDCLYGTGTYEYLLTVDSRNAGSAQASVFVNVIPVVQPTPTDRPTPEDPPVINYFYLDNDEIELDKCVNFSWSYSGSSITNAEIRRDNKVIASDLAPSGEIQDCPTTPGQLEYKLKITSMYLGSAKALLYLYVIPPLQSE